jgi:acyl-CoA synthetase (AMP-forming)/AMP-acid ligase II
VNELKNSCELAQAITNHLLLITPVNFLILPSAFFLSAIHVTLVKEVPKTATGKIQKYVLRAQRPAIAPQ